MKLRRVPASDATAAGPQQRARPGRQVDIGFLFHEHEAFVQAMIRRLGGHHSDVDDITQEVFVVLQRKIDQYDGSRPFRPWLVAVIHRCVCASRRRAHLRREVPTSELPECAADASQVRHLERMQDRAELEEALEALSDDLRSVFLLYELEELTMAEVAAAVQCPVQTAYSRLRAAKGKLRRTLWRARLRSAVAAVTTTLGTGWAASKASAAAAIASLTPAKTAIAVAALAGTTWVGAELASEAGTNERTASASTGGAAKPATLGHGGHAMGSRPLVTPEALPPTPPPAEAIRDETASAQAHATGRQSASRHTGGRPSAKHNEPVRGVGTKSASETLPALPTTTSTVAELTLMQQAREVLVRDPAHALRLTRRHQAEFPQGVLAEERAVFTIRALVSLNRLPQASAEVERFARNHPRSVHLERLRRLVAPM